MRLFFLLFPSLTCLCTFTGEAHGSFLVRISTNPAHDAVISMVYQGYGVIKLSYPLIVVKYKQFCFLSFFSFQFFFFCFLYVFFFPLLSEKPFFNAHIHSYSCVPLFTQVVHVVIENEPGKGFFLKLSDNMNSSAGGGAGELTYVHTRTHHLHTCTHTRKHVHTYHAHTHTCTYTHNTHTHVLCACTRAQAPSFAPMDLLALNTQAHAHVRAHTWVTRANAPRSLISEF